MNPDRRMTVTVAIACVLTSTVLYPLFNGVHWFFAGIGAVIAVAAAGTLSRLRTLPVVACLAIGVLGLLLYLNVLFEARHSLLAIIPTPTSVSRLWDLAGTGITDSSKYAPSALSMARYPAVLRQNTMTVPAPVGAFMVMGTVNNTSSGRPASAVDRSRTAIRSASTAVMPIPPAAMSTRPGRFGAGGAYLLESVIPVPARSHSLLTEVGVGMIASSE